jgi:chemotaxis protein MotB
MEKGLVITFVADILFDSGKAELRSVAFPTLDKVARVLRENVPDLNVGIEGHTDNVPIKHSSWKSNWELSAHRALSVLHYLAEDKGITPTRLSALAYGEYHPVASNGTAQGRQLNRRVEIVILPRVSKVKEGESGARAPAHLK